MLTAAQVRNALHYDPDTGTFTRDGKVAGCMQETGYRHIRLHGSRYLAHRLAWLYVHGEWPIGDMDHANGNRADNRLSNLRQATRSQNNANRKAGATGLKGVSRDKRDGRFYASIMVDRHRKKLGGYDTAEAAHAAYMRAAEKIFGQFARAA